MTRRGFLAGVLTSTASVRAGVVEVYGAELSQNPPQGRNAMDGLSQIVDQPQAERLATGFVFTEGPL